MAAALLQANQNFSKTDVACSWKAPTCKNTEAAAVSDLFPVGAFKALTRNVDEGDKAFLPPD